MGAEANIVSKNKAKTAKDFNKDNIKISTLIADGVKSVLGGKKAAPPAEEPKQEKKKKKPLKDKDTEREQEDIGEPETPATKSLKLGKKALKNAKQTPKEAPAVKKVP